MSLTAADKASIIDAHKKSENDTGSPEVQIALLTRKIEVLSEHMKANKHDYHSRRGLLRFVSQRRKLLDYLKRVEIERYRAIIELLGLRN